MKKKTLPCGRLQNAVDPIPKAAQLEAWHQQLKAFLTRENLKYTEQRWKIAQIILSTGGHLDTQGLAEKVKEKHREIGAATVYRSIKVLRDAGILKESLTDDEGRVIYEIEDNEHHDHIVCLNCKAIFEFHSDRIEQEQSQIMRQMEFSPIRHRHVIYANCKHLQESRPSKGSK